jgi:hypothetical protein
VAIEDEKRDRQAAIERFLKPAPKAATERAVEHELKRVREQFNFSNAELRRLRRPRGRVA